MAEQAVSYSLSTMLFRFTANPSSALQSAPGATASVLRTEKEHVCGKEKIPFTEDDLTAACAGYYSHQYECFSAEENHHGRACDHFYGSQNLPYPPFGWFCGRENIQHHLGGMFCGRENPTNHSSGMFCKSENRQYHPYGMFCGWENIPNHSYGMFCAPQNLSNES